MGVLLIGRKVRPDLPLTADAERGSGPRAIVPDHIAPSPRSLVHLLQFFLCLLLNLADFVLIDRDRDIGPLTFSIRRMAESAQVESQADDANHEQEEHGENAVDYQVYSKVSKKVTHRSADATCTGVALLTVSASAADETITGAG
jgi:hypothetical protein